mmetsp:Transcript_16930/g.69111  ORF Transcript_16930/g.69111 Transcript_16930/m.69111 type:complete len:211 (-) Transcript_16930:399-1031(-)
MRVGIGQGYYVRHVENDRTWRLFDCKGVRFGDAAKQIAWLLMGKHKPTYERTLLNYDPVVAINVKYLEFSGRRMFDKVLIYHTRYPGGQKKRSYEWYMKKQDGWENPFRRAVEKMVQGKRERAKELVKRKLYLYPAEEHDIRNKRLEPVPNIGTTARMGLGGAPAYDEMEDLWVRTMSMLPPEVKYNAFQSKKLGLQPAEHWSSRRDRES